MTSLNISAVRPATSAYTCCTNCTCCCTTCCCVEGQHANKGVTCCTKGRAIAQDIKSATALAYLNSFDRV